MSGVEEPTELLKRLLSKAKDTERPDIEFKRTISIETVAQKAEFAKDIALQANLDNGGNIIYGVDNDGAIVGLSFNCKKDDLANVLVNRLFYAPPGIEIIPVTLETISGGPAELIWIRIPPSKYAMLTSFLGSDGTWKTPVRIDTVTKYLSPPEAVDYYRKKVEGRPRLPDGIVSDYGNEPDLVREVLETNILPFIDSPRTIWIAPTNFNDESEVRKTSSSVPPFRIWKHKIVCLRESRECEVAFVHAIKGEGHSEGVDRFIDTRDKINLVKGLLNQELVELAKTLSLGYDEKHDKVFIKCEDSTPIERTWQSFSRQATRTVVGYNKKLDGSIRYWYHFAASIKADYLNGNFVLVIEPSWVFTKDGTKPLESYRMSTVATKRLNLEDNARILYNNHFWYQLLSNNGRFIILKLAGGDVRISAKPMHYDIDYGIANDEILVTALAMDDDIPVLILEETTRDTDG